VDFTFLSSSRLSPASRGPGEITRIADSTIPQQFRGEEAEFVNRLGLFMQMLGGPGTMGRVYGWLLICDPPQQSLTQLAEALKVSKASVSTVARQLQEGGMIERLPSPTRQHLYRVKPGGFASVLDTQLSRMRLGIDAADFRDFCEFAAQDCRDPQRLVFRLMYTTPMRNYDVLNRFEF
jgi:hypothetical protein